MISEINTVEDLNKNLNMGPGYGGYLDMLKAIKLPKEEWENYCLWKEDKYTRNCLSNCDAYELILMCWGKEQHSPIHTYNFQEGWIKVLEGELSIDLYRIDKDSLSCVLDETIVIKEKEYTYLNDTMGFHRVRASADGKTVSLHLHSERVREWEVFKDCKKEFQMEKPQYDSKTEECSE